MAARRPLRRGALDAIVMLGLFLGRRVGPYGHDGQRALMGVARSSGRRRLRRDPLGGGISGAGAASRDIEREGRAMPSSPVRGGRGEANAVGTGLPRGAEQGRRLSGSIERGVVRGLDGPGDVLEGDVALDVLASENGLVVPVYEDADVAGAIGRHDVT